MMRRVLLSGALAAAAFAPVPAQANEICILTVTLTGAIDRTVEVPCLDYDHGTICDGSTVDLVLQKVTYEVCLPQPLVQPVP